MTCMDSKNGDIDTVSTIKSLPFKMKKEIGLFYRSIELNILEVDREVFVYELHRVSLLHLNLVPQMFWLITSFELDLGV